jgi:hypothetical protein
MKTQRRILLVVGVLALAFAGLVVLAEFLLGAVLGSVVVLGAVVIMTAAYFGLIRPWLLRWGASAGEVARPMPGDGILGADAASTTRAITIGVPAHDVWPWLAQLGYGRAGWYSYDWLDNDGQPSARRIHPEWQQRRPGDRILMMPGSGFDVTEVRDGRYFTARAPDQTMSWCLAVEPAGQRSCRLISRWRVRWHVTPASAAWIALSEPGAFIMERRMLLGIRARAEQAAGDGYLRHAGAGNG